jgi:hypothetical protein
MTVTQSQSLLQSIEPVTVARLSTLQLGLHWFHERAGGLIFGEKNSVDLAASLRRILADPVLRKQLAAEGRQAVLDIFSLPSLAETFVRTIDQSVCGSNATASV